MGLGLRRGDLRVLAEAKAGDATILFQNGRYSNAYYLAGYAIELGLKACIAAQMMPETIPDKSIIKNILNHQLMSLVGLAGLAQPLKEEQDNNPKFASNWAVVSEWEPDSRYQATDQTSAQLLLQAILDPNDGVLRWIKQHW